MLLCLCVVVTKNTDDPGKLLLGTTQHKIISGFGFAIKMLFSNMWLIIRIIHQIVGESICVEHILIMHLIQSTDVSTETQRLSKKKYLQMNSFVSSLWSFSIIHVAIKNEMKINVRFFLHFTFTINPIIFIIKLNHI